MADVDERKLWEKYQDAYEDMIRNTSRPEAPWYVVPADHKWFTRMVIAACSCASFVRSVLIFRGSRARRSRNCRKRAKP